MLSWCRAEGSGPTTRVAFFFFLLLAACVVIVPSNAYLYKAAVSVPEYPATYAAAHAAALPIGGLYKACVEAVDSGSSDKNRGVLILYTASMATLLAEVMPKGEVWYIGGFYVTELKQNDGWCWDDGRSSVCPGLFCIGAACKPVSNSTVLQNWATGYPVLNASGGVGTKKYMAYDASLKGWINVDGTTALDGVACQSSDQLFTNAKKKFPWWGILIIVLGSVVIIAVVVTIVVCCCCCKKKAQGDDEDESTFSSRSSSSFSSRSSSFSGTSRSSSFSSRGSSFSGSSKSSGVTGSTDEGSSSSFSSQATSRSSSFSTRSGSTSFSTRSGSSSFSTRSGSSSYMGSSSAASSSRGSDDTSTSSSAASSSRASTASSVSPRRRYPIQKSMK